jgi:hypothetical protein
VPPMRRRCSMLLRLPESGSHRRSGRLAATPTMDRPAASALLASLIAPGDRNTNGRRSALASHIDAPLVFFGHAGRHARCLRRMRSDRPCLCTGARRKSRDCASREISQRQGEPQVRCITVLA